MNNYTSLVSGNFYKYQPYSEPNVLYVDLGGVNGIAHTGTASDPFRTLEYAITRVQAGQTIQLNAGIHYIAVTPMLPQYVNLRGVGSDKTFLMPVLTIADTAFHLIDAGDSGVDPVNNPGFNEISGICFDGNNEAVGYGYYSRRRNNTNIHHCIFTNFYFSGIDMRNGTIPIAVHAVGCQVHDNQFINCAGWTGVSTTGALQQEGYDNIEIYNNYFYVPGELATRNGTPIKGWNGSHIAPKIHHNVILKEVVDNDTDVGFCIELGQVYGGCEIHDNIISGDIDLVNCELGTYSYGAKIYNNVASLPRLYTYTSDTMVFPFLSLERSSCGIYVYHNTVINYGRSIVISTLAVASNVNNVNIFYNKFINIGTVNNINNCRALTFSSDNNGHTHRNVRIFNNLFIGKVAGATDCAVWLPENSAATRHIYIKNNIIMNMNDAPIWGRGGGAGYSAPMELEIDNNLIHTCGNANNPLFDFGYVPDAGTYTFNNNVQGVDPLFVDTTVLNYHLQAASPARDLGIVNYAVFEDFDNIPIKNQPNIGVYER
jgi:hypothetical protein